MRTIPNVDLTLDMIPSIDSDWGIFFAFSLTFDGYKECGSLEACAEIANARRCSTLTELRICLFFEQRRWRHFDETPDGETMAYLRSLVEKIRDKIANKDLM